MVHRGLPPIKTNGTTSELASLRAQYPNGEAKQHAGEKRKRGNEEEEMRDRDRPGYTTVVVKQKSTATRKVHADLRRLAHLEGKNRARVIRKRRRFARSTPLGRYVGTGPWDRNDYKCFPYEVPPDKSSDLGTALGYALQVDEHARYTARQLIDALNRLEGGRIELMKAPLPNWFRNWTPEDQVPLYARHWGQPRTPAEGW
jgi:hypothetical protein